MLALLVALAAGVGAVVRYVLDQLMTSRRQGGFPVGTFVVNVSGSFVLGLSTGLALHQGLGGDAAAVVGAGFAGGFTTFSTWAGGGLALPETGAARVGGGYGGGSFAGGGPPPPARPGVPARLVLVKVGGG